MVFLAIKKIRSTAKIRRFFFGTWSNNSIKRLNIGVWPNALFQLSIKWKLWNNSIKWLVKFRSSEKCQFQSSEIRSSDHLPLAQLKHWKVFHNNSNLRDFLPRLPKRLRFVRRDFQRLFRLQPTFRHDHKIKITQQFKFLLHSQIVYEMIKKNADDFQQPIFGILNNQKTIFL